MVGLFIQQQTQDQAQAMLSNKTPLQLLWFKTVITTTAVITVAFLWWWTTEARRVRKIVRRDGSQTLPTPAPVLPRWIGFLGGHTLRINIKKMITQMENWAHEFGGDYVLHAFGRHMVVVTSAADIRRILTLRPAKFVRGVDHEQSLWAATEAGFAPSLFFEEGKEWGRSRRLISPNLVGKNISAMIPYVSKIGERLCDKLGKRADLDEVVDVRGYFARFTHDIIALAAFGVDVDSTSATDDRPCRSFQAIESGLSTLNGLLFDATKIFQWKYLPNVVPWIQRFKEDARHLDDIVKRTIDAARNSVDQDASTSGREEDFAGTLLRKIISRSHADTKNDRMKFSDDEVVNQVKTLFVAGTDTTALAISWAMYYLVKNPMAFARCRAEGLSAAPSSGGMVSTPEQLSQLRFCAAVFREVVRLRGAGPGLPHTSLEDHTLSCGYKIKNGDAVMVLCRFASISEDNFSRGAEFVPERWIESERVGALLGKGVEDGEQGEIRHNEDAFFGFGGGPRVCPGKDMAKVEATMIIAAICSRFDVCLAPCQSDPPEEELQSTVGPAAVHLIFKRKVDGGQD